MSEVFVYVTGKVGSGKSSVASEIEIALRSVGVNVRWEGGEAERNGVPIDSMDPGLNASLVVVIRELSTASIPEEYFGDHTLGKSSPPL